MGHTLVDGTVCLDVDNVSDLVGLKVGGEGDGTLLAEVAREKVPGAGAETCMGGLGDFVLALFSHDPICCKFYTPNE